MLATVDLTFGYHLDEPVLEHLTWKFPPGHVTAVIGASGRGKSTLLYVLGLLVTPQAGSVILDGEDLSTWPDRRRAELRARTIGFVFQDAALDTTRTVLDNILEGSFYAAMDRQETTRRAFELMERFDVGLRADHKPGEISGGQAARVALCRAFITDPRIILADEPTGNLDQRSAAVVLDALTDAAEGGAIVVIASHDPEVTERTDAVLDLDAR